MLRAAQGDMAEVSTSQMALKKAEDPGVKQVAQRLITDHSQSLQEGTGLATLLGLTAPKDAGVTNMAITKQLMSAKGKDFDKQYMAGQVETHENVVALYRMELSQGQNPQVKAFAAKYLPGIESHTAQIYQVAQSVGAPGIQLRPSMPPMDSAMMPMSPDTQSMGTSPLGNQPSGTSPTTTPPTDNSPGTSGS